MARLENDRNIAFERARLSLANFVGVLILKPVDARGFLLLDAPSDWKIVPLMSRVALEDWFASITYESRVPGYDYIAMGIDKTRPMAVSRPNGTSVQVAALEKTLNVPSRPMPKPAYIVIGPMLAGAFTGAYLAEKRPVAGGVVGGALGALVGVILSRLGA
jgi:hypothetical protein